MRRSVLGLAVWGILVFLIVGSSRAIEDESPTAQLQRALDQQQAWLRGQPSAADWNRFLLTDELQAELAKPDAPSRHTVLKVLSRYESGEPGLRLPAFATTRRALSDLAGELGQPPLAELPELARQAKDQFRPISKAELLSSQVAVEAAIRRLERYLGNSGANGVGWRRHLQLGELSAELAKGINADPRLLSRFAAQFVAGQAGLELPQFASVGSTLHTYANLLSAYQNPEAREQYQTAIDRLVEQLQAAADTPEQFDREALGETLGAIAASGQANALVRAVRRQFAQPNLLVQVSGNIVTSGIQENIDENTPITDVILGTQIAGNGRTRGVVTGSLLPSENRATIQLTLRGTTASKTVGRNGPATIFSSANTSLLGAKRIYIDELGFSSSLAEAECCTQSHIDDICINGGRIIQKVATKRIYGSKATGEAISADHAAVRLETRMDTRTGGLLENVNRNYNVRFRNPLARKGAFPAVFRFSTTADWLSVIGMQARDNELAAGVAPPDVSDNVQLSIRAHESLIENMMAATMAGQTARDEDFKRMLRNFHGQDFTEEELKAMLRNIRDGDEPYEDFASLLQDREERPISAEEYAALQTAIGQRQLSPEQFERFIQPLSKAELSLEQANAMLGDLPEESMGSLTFASSRPVAVRFRDGGFSITLRSTAHSSRTGVERNLPMNITARYKVERNGNEVVATRQGEIEVDPPGFQPGDRLDLQQTTARRTLRTRFEEIFEPELRSTGLTLRGRWKQIGEMPWTQLVLENGWIAAGWAPTEPIAQAGSDKIVAAEIELGD